MVGFPPGAPFVVFVTSSRSQFGRDTVAKFSMDIQLLKIVGQVAGLGGLALGIFLLLFKDLLKKIAAPALTKGQWFKVVMTFMILVWSIAALGLAAWVYATVKSSPGSKSLHIKDSPGAILQNMEGSPNSTQIGNLSLQVINRPSRSLSSNVLWRLQNALRSTPEFPVQIFTTNGEADTLALANQIRSSFEAVGWKSLSYGQMTAISDPERSRGCRVGTGQTLLPSMLSKVVWDILEELKQPTIIYTNFTDVGALRFEIGS